MKIDILTLFPDAVRASLDMSILGRAAKRGILDINCVQVRDYTDNRQQQVDDYPYGGGWGCVMMAQPLKACLDEVLKKAAGKKSRVIYLSPQGKPFTQETAKRLVRDYDHLALVCGHYEGVDERFVEACVDEELSLGDFVLTGGEIAAMAVTDCVCRLVPGVLSDEECFTGESHWEGLLEYPQYTRPEVWEGRRVPEVLLSGRHADVARWRRARMLERTLDRRPDLFGKFIPSETDQALLSEILASRAPAKPPKPVFDYRRATPGDMEGVMAIVRDAQGFLKSRGVDQWQNGYPNPGAFSADMEKGDCWLFLHGDEPVGVVTLAMGEDPAYAVIHGGRWKTEGSLYGAIHRCAVRDGYRSTGLAGEMLSLCEDLAAGLGALSMRMDTHRDNRAMRRLVAKRGYEYCGVVYLSGPEEGQERLAFEKILV